MRMIGCNGRALNNVKKKVLLLRNLHTYLDCAGCIVKVKQNDAQNEFQND